MPIETPAVKSPMKPRSRWKRWARSFYLRLRGQEIRKRPSPGEWERQLEEIVAENVARALPYIPKEHPVMVDVGANDGIFTDNILRQRPGCTAYLFEPVTDHYERCVQRFAQNPRVTVEHFGLGDKNEQLSIWKPRHNPGGNTMVADIASQFTHYMDFDEEKVQCRIFSEYAREKDLKRADFIKTDAEGFDYRVLKGMLGFLERCDPKPVILSELMAQRLHNDWQGQLDVLESLYAMGYQRVDLEGMDTVDDFLFIPDGRQPLV